MAGSLLARVQKASEKSLHAKLDFHKAIRDAATEHTVREIARFADLSPARIHQILQGR